MEVTNLGPTPDERIYNFSPEAYELALDRLAKLQATARKLGVQPVALIKLDEILVPYHELDKNGKPTETEFLKLEYVCLLTGTRPKLPPNQDGNEWEFIGTIQHEELGNVIKLAPIAQQNGSFPLDTTAYRAVHQKCDHCQAYRSRRDTYLVAQRYDDTHTVMQVGSSCIKDFLGHTNPELLLSYVYDAIAFANDADDPEMRGWRGTTDTRYFDTIHFLTHTATMVRLHGYLSKAKAIEVDAEPTVSRVWHNIDQFEERFKLYNDYEPPIQEDVDTAVAAHTWLVETYALKPVEARSEFEHNLIVAASPKQFERRLGGFVAYVIQAHKRAIADVIEKSKTKRVNKHIGDVGDKLTLKNLTVVRVFEYDNNFNGVTYKHIFTDRHGNSFVWSTGTTNLPQGTTWNVTGTVKDHTTYKDINQTILTRCKVVRYEEPTSLQVNLTGAK